MKRISILTTEAEATLRGSASVALLLDSLMDDPLGAHHLYEAARRAGKSRAQLDGLTRRFVGVTWHEFVLLHRLSLVAPIWCDPTLKRLVLARKAGCNTVRAYRLSIERARALSQCKPQAVGIRFDLFRFPSCP